MKVSQGRLRSSSASSQLYYTALQAVIFFVAASASFFGYYQKAHFLDQGLGGDYGGPSSQ